MSAEQQRKLRIVLRKLCGTQFNCVNSSNRSFKNLAQYFMGLGDRFVGIDFQCRYLMNSSHTLLSLAGVKLIFFTAVHMTLFFRPVTKTVLTTHQCFSYCFTVFHSIKVTSIFHSRILAVGKILGQDTARTADSNKSDILYHTTSCFFFFFILPFPFSSSSCSV